MILLLDIGGSVTRVSVGEVEGDIETPRLFATEQDPDAACARITHVSSELLKGRPLDAVVAGVAGHIKNGTLVKAPNLPLWEGKNIARILEKELNTSAYVLNDAVLGGMGEAHKGAGIHAHTLLYMTLGTGIGASRIIEGKPDLSIGSETGHQYLMVDNVPQEIEQLVSGRALQARYGKPAKELTDIALWEECSRLFSIALFNTILHLSPDTVVIGGSLVKEVGISIDRVREHVRLIGGRVPKLPTIKHATLGDIGGLYGAQAYAKHVLS